MQERLDREFRGLVLQKTRLQTLSNSASSHNTRQAFIACFHSIQSATNILADGLLEILTPTQFKFIADLQNSALCSAIEQLVNTPVIKQKE